MLVKELFRDSGNKHFGKTFEQFFKIVLEDAVFNEKIHENMKSIAKMKFLHIGFKIAEAMLKELIKMSGNEALKMKVAQILLLKFEGFRTMLCRNVNMPKNQLNEVAKDVKVQIVALLEQLKTNLSQDVRNAALDLIKGLFGPNSFTHFSSKKNMDVLNPLCSMLNEDQITSYIEYLSDITSKPSIREFYPNEDSHANSDDNEFAQQTHE